MLLILFLFVFLIIYGFDKNRVAFSNWKENSIMPLRGICAVEIMIGHIGLATDSIVLYPNRKAGILFVGIFFLLSGYGCSYSEQNKQNYFEGFLVKKFVRLFVPTYFCYVMCILLGMIMNKSVYFSDVLDVRRFIENINWYVWELFLFYVLYWFGNRFFHRYLMQIMGIVSIIFIYIAYVLEISNPWYGSTMCFWVGMLFYKYEKDFYLWIKEKKVFKVIFGLLILIISIALFMIRGNDSILGDPIARNTAAVSFCFLVVVLLSEFVIGNVFSMQLGKCSYEIFLLHPFIQNLCGDLLEKSKFCYAICVIIITIILAVIVHKPINMLIMFINKKVAV